MNLGLGGVYRTGFERATGDLVTFFPADGQFPASILHAFYPLAAGHELVLGYLPQRDGSLLARGLSAAERVLYRALFGPMPRFQGVFMVRRTLLAGTLGNVHDRLERGYVIDFIDFKRVDWPTFNVADVSISAGIVLCVVGLVKAALRHRQAPAVAL